MLLSVSIFWHTNPLNILFNKASRLKKRAPQWYRIQNCLYQWYRQLQNEYQFISQTGELFHPKGFVNGIFSIFPSVFIHIQKRFNKKWFTKKSKQLTQYGSEDLRRKKSYFFLSHFSEHRRHFLSLHKKKIRMRQGRSVVKYIINIYLFKYIFKYIIKYI